MAERKKTHNDTDAVELDPNLLKLDREVQPRCRMSKPLIETYSQAMRAGDEFPHVVAYRDDDGTVWVADGFHRTKAAISAGLDTVKVEVRKGGKRDATLFAASCNANHGKHRTNADKRRAVLVLLKDDEWQGWSDREIARRCHVSDRFVNKVRAELSANGSQIARKRKVSRGGKTYSMDTSHIGSQGGDTGQQDDDDGAGPDAPGSDSADPDAPAPQPDEEITDPPGSEEESDDEDVEDDLVGALDDILEEVRGGGGDDDEENEDAGPESGGPAGSDDQVESDGEEERASEDDDPEENGDTTDSTHLSDSFAPPLNPSPLPAPAHSASTTKWALLRVKGVSFNDDQADALRESLAGGAYSHVLVLTDGNETGSYRVFQRACEALTETGFPLQFYGRLLRVGNLVVWAAIACRDGAHDDPVELLQQVLGGGTVGMGDVLIGGFED